MNSARQPLLQSRLRLVEGNLLARLELEAGVGELPVGDPGQVSGAVVVAFEQAEAGERCERVGHHLLEAELEGERNGAFEPVARLLEVAGKEVVAAEVVARDGRVLLVAGFQQERLLRVLDRALVVAALSGDVAEVGKHRSEPRRHVELAEERGALLEHLGRSVVVLAHRRRSCRGR